ncbi:DUF4365 domain-containing protein [Tetragenococcus halophilus]|uniref:DUF4365 domain-containing protein n=1 Tax=Tetragenococcus halophilus TaxID=51669 RepID=UPI00256E8816|nr:DUF4365 domain-containing protein [Tetragenococcus halophilus]GMG67016.1 DUF4365 domain-containing protein [Tetragenococcus halophilus]
MHSKQSEIFSIAHLEMELAETNYLEPEINKNDKEPSWDGFIYVNSDENFRKKSTQRVPVQVKGKYSEELNKEIISYSVEVTDLENYLKDHGVIYFVICVKNKKEYAIYYSTLDIIELKNILSKVKPNQKKKVIKLKRLPEENAQKINIFKSFLDNRKKQASFVDSEISTIEKVIQENGEVVPIFTLSGVGLNQENIYKYIDDNNVYMYARSPKFPIPIPTSARVEEVVPVEETSLKIGIDGKIFYKKVVRRKSKEAVSLTFGASFEFIVDYEQHYNRLNYKNSGSVRTNLKDLEFLSLLNKKGGFEIDRHFINLDEDLGPNVDILDKKLKTHKDIVSLLDYLNIAGDLNLKELTETEWLDLGTMIEGLIYGKSISLVKEVQLITIVQIQNYSIALVFNKDQENNLYTMEDLFQSKKSRLYSANEERDTLTKVPNFRGLTSKQLTRCSNIRFDMFLKEYKKLKNEPNILSDANNFLLLLIASADSVQDEEQKCKFLSSSLELVDWITKENKEKNEISTDVLKLNKLQIFKRQRKLKTNEINELFEIVDSIETDSYIKLAACILLDESRRAQRIFGNMESEEQKAIRKQPIFNLDNSI